MIHNVHSRIDIRMELINKSMKYDSDVKEMKLSKRFTEWLFRHYDIKEISIHFYDHLDEEVDDVWEDRMDCCNWVDVIGPGIWGDTQKSANRFAKECMNDFRRAGHLDGRSWIVDVRDSDGKEYVHVYLYGRDIHEFDLHFVLTRLRKPRTK